MKKREQELIVAIDGPSGAGKSTLSRLLARSLGYTHIDTGAMYRAIALAASRAGIDPEDGARLGELCAGCEISFLAGDGAQRVFLNGEDVSTDIRSPEISLLTSRVSACPDVRQAMVNLQRKMGEAGGVVLEGRDIGTVVFPGAEVKFYLLATAQERGRRRFEELRSKGAEVDLARTIAEVEARDAADSAREHAPLRQAPDAQVIDSTRLSIDEVLEVMRNAVTRRRRELGLPVEETCP